MKIKYGLWFLPSFLVSSAVFSASQNTEQQWHYPVYPQYQNSIPILPQPPVFNARSGHYSYCPPKIKTASSQNQEGDALADQLAEMALLQRHLSGVQDMNSYLEQDKNRCVLQLEHLELELKSLNKEKFNLEQVLNKKAGDQQRNAISIAKTNHLLKVQQQKNKQLTADLDAKQKALEQLQKKLQEEQTLLFENQNALANTNQNIIQKQQKLNQLHIQVIHLNEKIGALQLRVEKQAEKENEINQLYSTEQQQADLLSENLAAKNQEIQACQTQLHSDQDRLSQIETVLTQQKQAVMELNQEKEHLRQQLDDSEKQQQQSVQTIQNLQQQLTEAQKEKQNALDTMQALTTEKQTLSEQIIVLKQQIDENKAQIQTLSDDNTQKEAAIVQWQTKVDEVTSKMLSAEEEKKGAIKALEEYQTETAMQLKAKDKAFEDLQNQLTEVKQQLEQSHQIISDNEEKTALLSQKLSTTTQLLEQKVLEIKKFNPQINELMLQKKKLTSDFDVLQKKLLSTETKVQQYLVQEKTIEELNAKIGQLNADLSQEKTAIEQQLQQNKAQCLKQQQELQEKLNQCETTLAPLSAQLSKTKNEYQSLLSATVDTDNDGIMDTRDECPTTPEGHPINAQGCEPDDDKDGVVNFNDLCPQSKENAEVDATGCDNNEIISLAGVNFVSNSDELLTESTDILSHVAQTLKQHPQLNLEVAGHTDSAGDANYNLNLSQRRAEQVMRYLISQGIDAERLTAKGYGETLPIIDNATAAHRAMNRRVELRRQAD